jgi:hypothetical protein
MKTDSRLGGAASAMVADANEGSAAGSAEIVAPIVGSFVLVDMRPNSHQEPRPQPAIVTAVHGTTCINVRVLLDSDAGTPWVPSLQHVSQIGRPARFGQARPQYWLYSWEQPLP